MANGSLYNETLRSAMRETRTEPRESKAWLGWLVAGLIAGGGVVDVWHMYQARLESAREMRAAGYRHFPDLNLWYSGYETDEQVRSRYRTPAESQSGGHLSQPTAGAR